MLKTLWNQLTIYNSEISKSRTTLPVFEKRVKGFERTLAAFTDMFDQFSLYQETIARGILALSNSIMLRSSLEPVRIFKTLI